MIFAENAYQFTSSVFRLASNMVIGMSELPVGGFSMSLDKCQFFRSVSIEIRKTLNKSLTNLRFHYYSPMVRLEHSHFRPENFQEICKMNFNK